MFQGKINAAMKLLSDSNVGAHKVDEDILYELRQKHSQPATFHPETLLIGQINRVLPSCFNEIDETMTYKATGITKGAGGPSHLDAEQYRHILTSGKYKKY